MRSVHWFKTLITMFLCVLPLYSQDMSNLTLIAHYPLTSTANDTLGHYGPMILSNTPFQDGGIYCNGIYWGNGPNPSEAETPYITDLDLSFFAVSAKFNVVDPIENRLPVFVCGKFDKWCSVFIDPDNTVGLAQGGVYLAAESSGKKYTPGTWHEITFAFDSIAGIGRLYFDGTAADSSTNEIDHQNDRVFSITQGSVARTFKGVLKDLKIYSKTKKPPTGVESDSLILVTLYNRTDGSNWTHHDNWLTGPISTWYGLTFMENKLRQINLFDNNLSGSIPEELGDLQNLQILNLNGNHLAGSIPSALGNMTSLNSLILSDNQLTGSIPPELGSLSMLTQLNLGVNQLSDSLPSRLAELVNLSYLNLMSNQLSGAIFPEIENLSKLRYFYVSYNLFSGPIPPEIGNLSTLEYLDLSHNQLTGSIPASLGNLLNLESLKLTDNQLEGQIPSLLGQMTSLSGLELDKNRFNGAVPVSLNNLTHLNRLYITNNQFTDLPDLSSLTKLNFLYVENNRLTFEDLEPNTGVSRFLYIPQDSVGESVDTTFNEGQNLVLETHVGGTANLYKWFKNDVELTGSDSSVLVIESISFSDSGSYTCQIRNSIVDQLTLFSRPMHVSVVPPATAIEQEQEAPLKFALIQNYPNPFNPSTEIEYQLPQSAEVELIIFDIQGQVVRELVRGKKTSGCHQTIWDGCDQSGNKVATGVYFYRLEAKSTSSESKFFIDIKKMILMK